MIQLDITKEEALEVAKKLENTWQSVLVRKLIKALKRAEETSVDTNVCSRCEKPLGSKYYQDVPPFGENLCLNCHPAVT